MNILMINSTDKLGGAARAAFRLHKGLINIGINSKLLVQKKYTEDEFVYTFKDGFIKKQLNKLRPILDTMPMKLYPNRKDAPWGINWIPRNLNKELKEFNPDIVNLHWICNGLLPIGYLEKFKVPIVWSLHDSWAFTGGCNIPYECIAYEVSCGECPQLNSSNKYDLSYWVLKNKIKAWSKLGITIVAPSKWLADRAKSSCLFKNNHIEIIPNGLDTNIYKPINKSVAREAFNLPQNKKLILFGALNSTSDPNKGFALLKSAIEKFLLINKYDCEIVVFGSNETQKSIKFSNIQTTYIGKLNDDTSLALLYSAADVMIVPSIQEAFGQTASEAISCGTPVVAFASTGLLDIVDHKNNGYLAKPFDVEELSYGVNWVLEHEERTGNLSRNARNKAIDKFSIEKIARSYSDLYQRILKRSEV